jgi:hypothetical protein
MSSPGHCLNSGPHNWHCSSKASCKCSAASAGCLLVRCCCRADLALTALHLRQRRSCSLCCWPAVPVSTVCSAVRLHLFPAAELSRPELPLQLLLQAVLQAVPASCPGSVSCKPPQPTCVRVLPLPSCTSRPRRTVSPMFTWQQQQHISRQLCQAQQSSYSYQ